jgi:transposase-like protein
MTPAETSLDTSAVSAADAESVEADGESRARPGRRSVEDRRRAVLEVLSGKATIDQVARRLGVLPSTVEGWRQDALSGIEEALRRGTGKSGAEQAMERKVRDLEKVVTTLSIQKCLLENALETERGKRPTEPARSRR